MKDILVFFGGVSAEHDISIITGVFTLNSIDKNLFNPIPIYVHSDGIWFSGNELFDINFYKNFNSSICKKVTILPFDVKVYEIKKNKMKAIASAAAAISCMHGINGEDGAICGLLQMSKIPFASPNMFCSSLSMDKWQTKNVVAPLGIECVTAMKIDEKMFFKDKEDVMLKIVNEFKYPLIIKPINLGSSIGISIAKDYVELGKAFENAFKFDNEVLVEKYLVNAVDINCAAYKTNGKITVSECEMPVTANEILTFDDKYQGSKMGITKEFPAKISEVCSQKIKSAVKEIYCQFGFFGIVRFDFLLCGNDVYLNEINSVPGSLAYYLFCKKISEFTNLLTEILNESMQQSRAKFSVFTEFKSNVLSGEFQRMKK